MKIFLKSVENRTYIVKGLKPLSPYFAFEFAKIHSKWHCHGILSEHSSQTIPNSTATMWQCHLEAGSESGSTNQIQQDYTKFSKILEWHCHIVTAPFRGVSVEFECKTQALESLQYIAHNFTHAHL